MEPVRKFLDFDGSPLGLNRFVNVEWTSGLNLSRGHILDVDSELCLFGPTQNLCLDFFMTSRDADIVAQKTREYAGQLRELAIELRTHADALSAAVDRALASDG